jgi:hypothetical protein
LRQSHPFLDRARECGPDSPHTAPYRHIGIEIEMQPAKMAFRPRRSQEWTAERIGRLGLAELRQLRENAERLGETAVVALCDTALQGRPGTAARRASVRATTKRARHLVSRSKAFQARGVYLPEQDSSWSGVRKSDGAIVMSLWAPAIGRLKGACNQLLWGPNVDGSRPWSDTLAGQERLAHCKLALERGRGEGLLVYGENFDGDPTESNARSVHGADPEYVVDFKVEQRGGEYWAVWGEKKVERPL